MFHSVDQNLWRDEALSVLGNLFRGATAFASVMGVWRPKEPGSALMYDQPMVIECYTNCTTFDKHAEELHAFLVAMGKACNQLAVGYVVDNEYFEIEVTKYDEQRGT